MKIMLYICILFFVNYIFVSYIFVSYIFVYYSLLIIFLLWKIHTGLGNNWLGKERCHDI